DSAAPAIAGGFFFAVLTSESSYKLPLWVKDVRPISIVILDSETPTILELLAAKDIDAVLMKPFRPSGLLATLVHAQHQWHERAKLHGEIDRLQRKLGGFRNVEKAKEIIAVSCQVSPDQAFAILRENAMRDRTTV